MLASRRLVPMHPLKDTTNRIDARRSDGASVKGVGAIGVGFRETPKTLFGFMNLS
jgi:hypothetical protein